MKEKEKEKGAENSPKRRGGEFEIRWFGIFLIVMHTKNGFSKATKLIIILIITK